MTLARRLPDTCQRLTRTLLTCIKSEDSNTRELPICIYLICVTDQVYTDRQLARVSVLTFDVTSAVYASACGKCLASVMKKFNKKIDRKNLNFGNKTAILKNIYF